MAKVITPLDACAIVTSLVKEYTGQTVNIASEDVSSFVSAGQMLRTVAKENILNSIGILVSRTLVKNKRYSAFFSGLTADESQYNALVREIYFRSQLPQESGAYNTDENTNFATGYDNGTNSGASVGTMWEQKPSDPVEVYFGGTDVWDDEITIYQDKLEAAFNSPTEFADFVEGMMIEKLNDIESQKEAYNTITLLNRIAANIYYEQNSDTVSGYGMETSAVNLTAAYNEFYGLTSTDAKTTAELLSTDLESFLKFFVSEFKIYSDRMKRRSGAYHYRYPRIDASTSAEVAGVLNFTPKERQRAYIYGPLLTRSESIVMPTLFNPEYTQLPKGSVETVDYWQNFNDPMSIKVKPALPDMNGSGQTAASAAISATVVGILFDENAIKTNYILDSVNTTPVEARKKYFNQFWHMSKRSINRFVDNAIVFYMADPTPDPDDGDAVG